MLNRMCFVLLFLSSLWACTLNAQIYILDTQFNSAPALPAGFVGTGTFGSASSVNNFGRNAPSLQFTTNGQTLTYGPWTGDAEHISFYHKANASGGSTILVQESVDGLSWTDVGTCTIITTSATWDADLLNTSRYIRLIFTLSGSSKPYIDDLRIRCASADCSDPIKIKRVLINGGCSQCEDSNEFVHFNTGGDPLKISYFELVNPYVVPTTVVGGAYGGNGSADNLNVNWINGASNSVYQLDYIYNLNLWAGCDHVFVPVPNDDIIPAHAEVLAITGAAPDAVYDLNSMCASDTVYVMFSTRNVCPTGSGKYANASCSSNCTRFITIFNHQTGCLDNQEYLANSSSTDEGDMYVFDGPLTGYVDNISCFALTLPTEILSFSAQALKDKISLHWTANEESENINYELQRSADGTVFRSFAFLSSDSDFGVASYEFVDENPQRGVTYYRIAYIKENGESAYSNLISVIFNGEESFSAIRGENGRIVLQSDQNYIGIQVQCFATDGRLLLQMDENFISGTPLNFQTNHHDQLPIILLVSENGHPLLRKLLPPVSNK